MKRLFVMKITIAIKYGTLMIKISLRVRKIKNVMIYLSARLLIRLIKNLVLQRV